MEISIVKIGKSKGIRIPKNIIDQFDIKDRIELEVHETEAAGMQEKRRCSCKY